jgi:hypothetical protein
MKKGLIVFIIASVFAIGSAFGQSDPWKGFFSPKSQSIPIALQKKSLNNTSGISTTSTWLFRPAITASGLDLTFKGGQLVTQPYGAVGMGIEYGNYTLVNGQPYSLVAVDAMLITNYSLNGNNLTGLGASISVKGFNIVSLGVGYLNNSVHILAGINYTF